MFQGSTIIRSFIQNSHRMARDFCLNGFEGSKKKDSIVKCVNVCHIFEKKVKQFVEKITYRYFIKKTKTSNNNFFVRPQFVYVLIILNIVLIRVKCF